MAYTKTIWENSPSENTPLSAENLNNIENGIDDVDTRLTTVETVVNEIDTNVGDTSTLTTTSNEVVGAINENKSNIDILINTNDEYDIIVDINGNGDYTSLTTAVSNAVDGQSIYVKNGTYDNEAINCVGKKLTIIGQSKDGVIVQNSYDDYNTPPLEIGKGVVKNISFLQNSDTGTATSRSYAVHIDYNDLYQETLDFENCYFYSKSSAAVGIGMKNECVLTFKDCSFYNENNDSSNYIGALFVHNAVGVAYQGNNQILVIDHCQITSKYQSAMHLRYCGTATNYVFIKSYNSTYFSENASIFASKGVISSDFYETATVENIYVDGVSCGNSTEIMNGGKYVVGKTNQIGYYGPNTLNKVIKRKIYTGNAIVGTTNITIGDTMTTLIDIKGSIKVGNHWFPIQMHNSNGVNIITVTLISTNIQVVSTLAGNYLIILEYV